MDVDASFISCRAFTPGTVHAVVSVSDTNTEGGYFLCDETAVRSLYELLEFQGFPHDNANGDEEVTIGFRIERLYSLMAETTARPTLVRDSGMCSVSSNSVSHSPFI